MKKLKITKILTFVVVILMVLTVNFSCYATSCSDIENSARSFDSAGKKIKWLVILQLFQERLQTV